MVQLLDHPVIMAGVCFLGLWGGTYLAVAFLRGRPPQNQKTKDDFGVILAAVLTLLGLLIGFTFSMAISRYDQRKNYEEAEANAIGTEYVRADLLPAADAARVHGLLRDYTAQRILFYGNRSRQELKEIAVTRAKLQDELWAAVKPAAVAQPNPVNALILSGMNDVLNSQGYTLAAWLNRIPYEAWILLLLVALLSNVMVVYGAQALRTRQPLLFILPVVVSVSFLLIADIDSPRGGIIKVTAQNLDILAAGMAPASPVP